MRILVALLLVLTPVACGGDQKDLLLTSTTGPAVDAARQQTAKDTSEASPAESTAPARPETEGNGTNSISITDQITITITDPEDG